MTAPKAPSYNDTVYINRLRSILLNGNNRGDRTGTGTVSTFGGEDVYDLDNCFPLLCWRYVKPDPILGELVGFTSQATTKQEFEALGCKYWNPWANAEGELGPIYGQMWCSWPGVNGEAINQLDDTIRTLRNIPESRRLVVSGWNPALLPDETADHDTNIANGKQVLPPCHTLFQFYSQSLTAQERRAVYLNSARWDNATVESLYTVPEDLTDDAVKDQWLDDKLDALGVPKRALSCKLHQRSCDYVVGGFINIPSYGALTNVVAAMTGHHPLKFHHSLGDAHVYNDQFEAAQELVERHQLLQNSASQNGEPSRDTDPTTRTKLVIADHVKDYDSITQLRIEDLWFENHQYLPKMTIPVAV